MTQTFMAWFAEGQEFSNDAINMPEDQLYKS